MSKDNTLKKVRRYYESAVGSPAYRKWQAEARQAWAFYDGDQWTREEIERLSENAQPAIVINKLAAKIDNIAGTEIAGRTRILYRSRSGDAGEEATAKALSDLALYVAERNEQAIEISNMFKEGLVTGLGWLDVGVDQGEEGPYVFNRYEQALQVVWDPNARRNDYSDARFVCRERWLDEDDISNLFPTKGPQLVAQLNHQQQSPGAVVGQFVPQPADTPTYVDADNALFRVIEVQYRRTEKRYRVRTPDGGQFLTFDKDVAFANPDHEVDSEFAPRVYMAYFSDNLLLDHRPMPFTHNRFTLVPYIFKRDRSDGRPYGLVRAAIDPQRELNKRRSKAMHLLNTAQVIADVDAVEDPNILAREAARPDGLILKRPGKELRIIRNSDLAASQVAVMEQASRDIQEVIGVFDETIGKDSNATSGVAIQTRQTAGALNQMFAFDALRRAKKQLGIMVLFLIRQFFTAEMVIHITDQLGAPRVVRLNMPVIGEDGNPVTDAQGNPVLSNDVRAGTFDVLVEEVRDVLSSRELEMTELNLLMQAGVPVPPRLLVEATSLRNKADILQSLEGENRAEAPPVAAAQAQTNE